MGGRGIGGHDDPQPGSVSRLVAGDGILEGYRLARIDAQAAQRGEIHVGLGFAVGDIVAAGDVIEEGEQAAMSEVVVNVGVAGVGGDGEAESGGARGVDQFADTGEHGCGQSHLAGCAAVARFKGGAADIGGIVNPRVVGRVGMADDGVHVRAPEGHVVFFVKAGPGVDGRRFGVHDESVEIEDEGA